MNKTPLGHPRGCIYALGKPWGVPYLALHEIFLEREANLVYIKSVSPRFRGVPYLALHKIFLEREANLVSIKLASPRFFCFAALPCRCHISHFQTINNANSVSKLCGMKLSSTLVFIGFLRSPKWPRKIICLISGLSAQHVFRGPYLLAPWTELGFPYVQIKALNMVHNFGSQHFSIRGRLSPQICIDVVLGCANISLVVLILQVNLQISRRPWAFGVMFTLSLDLCRA
jgi:hypothetical protein